ncbi:hypothetical protein D3C85_1533100 [compost metagenome]
MADGAVEHVADDFHVAVAVGVEAGARRDAVIVDHAQIGKAHVRRIVVVAEGKAVAALQPAKIGLAAGVGGTDGNHVLAPWMCTDWRWPIPMPAL